MGPAGAGGTSVISRTEFKRDGLAWEGTARTGEAKRAVAAAARWGRGAGNEWGAAGAGAGRGERVDGDIYTQSGDLRPFGLL